MSSALSKRGQGTNSEEGSPMAKARPTNLVMHSQGMMTKEKELAQPQETGDIPIQHSKLDIPK